MSRNVRYKVTPATVAATPVSVAALMGLNAMIAAGHVDRAEWPELHAPVYVTAHSESTHSSELAQTVYKSSDAKDFGQEIAAIYASLSSGQEPLGAEFEAVWDENVAELYES